MGNTPLGFAYPASTDAPDVPAWLQTLAEDVDDYLTDVGTWDAYTPTLTAVTTSPTMGSGASTQGRYTRIGDTVIGYAMFSFGASGVSAGSGNYLMQLPTLAKQPGSASNPIGLGRVSDSSGSAIGFLPLFVQTDGDDKAFIRYSASWPTGTLTTVNHSTPWAWAANDVIAIWFAYEAYS